MMRLTFTILLFTTIHCALTKSVCQKGCKCKAFGFCYDCETGYYRQNNECKGCSTNCLSCFSNQKCDECKYGYYKNISNNGSILCRPCSTGCKNCTYVTHCSNCSDGYFKNGYRCTKCLSGCKTCKSKSNCLTCTNGYIMRGSSCRKCREGYFGSGNMCLPCQYNCASCPKMKICSDCKQGFYGKTCDQICSRGCVNSVCEQNTGNCHCTENYIGQRCDQCKPKKYGPDCNLDCPKECITCYSNESCDVCNSDARESKCNCSNGCLDNECQPFFKWHCEKCVDGKWGQDCINDCRVGCLECLSETNCTKCTEGYHYSNGQCLMCPTNCFNVSCNTDSGICGVGCRPGYRGIFCNESCPKNCLNGSCQNENGTCILGCKDDYHGHMCDCPNNCICNSSGQCLLSCRNSNLKNDDGFCGQQCESVCFNCSQNSARCGRCGNNTLYGDLCDKECSNTCIGRSCDTLTGKCISGCMTGYFGDTCSKQCSRNCLKLSCNRETGYCDFEKTNTENILLAIVAVLVIYAIVTTVVLIRKRYIRIRQPEVNVTSEENVDTSYQPVAHRNAAYSGHAYALPDGTSSGSILPLVNIGTRSSSSSTADRNMYIHPVYAVNTVRHEYEEIK